MHVDVKDPDDKTVLSRVSTKHYIFLHFNFAILLRRKFAAF